MSKVIKNKNIPLNEFSVITKLNIDNENGRKTDQKQKKEKY